MCYGAARPLRIYNGFPDLKLLYKILVNSCTTIPVEFTTRVQQLSFDTKNVKCLT